MLLVLIMIVFICLVGHALGEGFKWLPVITSSIGLIWFGISLIFLGPRSYKVKKGRDVEQSQQADLLNSSAPASARARASAPAPPIAPGDVEIESESIYENDNELFQKTQL